MGLYRLIFTLGIALSCSACIFGNRVEKDQPPTPPEPSPSPTTLTGYYETRPSELTMCATYVGADPAQPGVSAEKCAQVNTTYVPAEVRDIMTNPVGYAADEERGEALLIANTLEGARIPLRLKSDKSEFEFEAPVSKSLLWFVDTCFLNWGFEARNGQVRPGAPVTASHPDFPEVRGPLRVDFTSSNTIEGVCTSSLQEMSNCYQDISQCALGGEDPAAVSLYVRTFFKSYIDAGIMTAADIATVSAFAYEVLYR